MTVGVRIDFKDLGVIIGFVYYVKFLLLMNMKIIYGESIGFNILIFTIDKPN